ncbi:anhydro-N-acetylmuramic acid kinase [Ichthyenterobacterium sp. W332]|uniref:Anhydro-N-acetylmuramic acid kinase n=1 Tax=Microcosmobacter mediterraneus TaxID=3075607 RepID=A0ABU2YMK8_9FLAO|nr:anhydro-N-acetylmuramic acid kinase [Ichthyenterobacterium sp. W332]MDT0559402.1 anhydro-N-acetylmuramic acid kinase [Ichthyenterobacterium sp. W332]
MITNEYNVIGVMSGTSLDGIDLAYITFTIINDKWHFKIHNTETISYSDYWFNKLSKLTNISDNELIKIDESYTELLANAIQNFIDINVIETLDLVSSHGHTALHKPEDGISVQIGNRKMISNYIKTTVVCDFRIQDVKLGGQGAPLVPIGDRILFSDYEYCLNLGGFANISTEANVGRVAYDICPVNIVLNYYVRKIGLDFDDKGQLASEGTINKLLLDKLNQIKFYSRKPPKSLGLEWVEDKIFPLINAFNLEIKDVLRTFVEHVAYQISKAIEDNSKVFITGGGVFNDFLIARLKSMSRSYIIIPDNDIIEYKEALIFGLLGVLKLRGEVNCLKSVTGAIKDHSSGVIYNI